MRLRHLVVHGLLGLALASAGRAEADDFYKGKTITILVGAPAGGANDFYSRLFAAHLPDFIPGRPTIVVQDMPGAGGMIASNALYNTSPKDGTYLGSSLNTMALNEVLSPGQTKYRSERFSWIGRTEAPVHGLVAWAPSGVRTIADARTREVVTASTSPGTASQFFPNLANAYAGTRFKLVNGYEGADSIRLAMERGEIEASGSDTWSSIVNAHAQWVHDKKIVALFQMRFTRDPVLPDVPTLIELVHDPRGRAVVNFMTAIDAIGFNLMAPPDVPPDRLAVLRAAFMKMVADPAYVKQVRTAGYTLSPMSGADLQKLVDSVHSTPKDVIADFVKAATTGH